MSVTIDGTSGVTTPALTAGGTPFPVEGGFGMRNRIINGDMRIDQRNAGASFSTASGSSAYTVDRWGFDYSQTSKFTIQQNAGAVTPPTGYTNYLGITCSSAYAILSGDYFFTEQRIEGVNVGDLGWGAAGAKSVTLSFWVRSSLTGTFGGAFRNSAGTRSYPFAYTINAANTWEQKTINVAGDTSGTWLTNNGIGIRVSFSVGTGATYSGTAGAWATGNFVTATGATSVVGTTGATFYITGVQLEKGSVATEFQWRPYGTELALCQRYYQLTGGYFAATATVNETDAVGSCNVKVDMRANPTATLPVGARFHKPGIAFYAASAVSAGPTANGQGYQGVTIASGAGAGTVGQIDYGLILSAEL